MGSIGITGFFFFCPPFGSVVGLCLVPFIFFVPLALCIYRQYNQEIAMKYNVSALCLSCSGSLLCYCR
jgi:uncharacterized protein YqgC (DUF456 family)